MWPILPALLLVPITRIMLLVAMLGTCSTLSLLAFFQTRGLSLASISLLNLTPRLGRTGKYPVSIVFELAKR